MSVQAKDLATNKEQKILVTPSGGLTEDEIRAIIEDAQLHSEEDRRRARLIRDQSRLEGLLETNEKSFREFGSHLGVCCDERVRIHRFAPIAPFLPGAQDLGDALIPVHGFPP